MGKFPNMTSEYESVNVPNVFFAGVLAHGPLLPSRPVPHTQSRNRFHCARHEHAELHCTRLLRAVCGAVQRLHAVQWNKSPPTHKRSMPV